MPPKRTTTGLAGKLGAQLQKAHEAHKSDEVTVRSGDAPDGIEDGVAQLTMCKIDTYKTGNYVGEYYLLVRGTMVSPEKLADGRRVAGTVVSFGPEPICDTPDRQSRPTLEDHWAWVLNVLRLLGVNTEEMSWDNVEATCAELQAQQPYFRCRSWKGRATPQFPNPRTNYDFLQGDDKTAVCDWTGEAAEQVTDNTAESEPEAQPTDDQTPEADSAPAEEGDELTQLAEAAMGGDSDAENTLTERAKTVGVGGEAAAADNWNEVAEIIRNAEANPPEEKTGPVVPGLKEVCKYKVKGKLVDVTVIKLNKPAKTCDLQNLTDRKTMYNGVKWDQLVWE